MLVLTFESYSELPDTLDFLITIAYALQLYLVMIYSSTYQPHIAWSDISSTASVLSCLSATSEY